MMSEFLFGAGEQSMLRHHSCPQNREVKGADEKSWGRGVGHAKHAVYNG